MDSRHPAIAMHSYARSALENQLGIMDDLLNPESPSTISDGNMAERRPGKKSKKLAKDSEDENQIVSNAALMTVMERIERMQEESLRKLHSLETTVKDNTQTIKSVTDSLEYLGRQVEDVSLQVDSLQTHVETLEKENAVLRDRWSSLETSQRRGNLRVAGVPERTGEDIKKTIIDILAQVSPDIAQDLHLSVDLVHRLGPRPADHRSSRRIMVQFLSRSHRDKIWRDARTSKFLKERNVKIFEDLTQDMKDARNKLWPLVEQARKEGKKAGFRGAHALIDGKRITVNDMKNDT